MFMNFNLCILSLLIFATICHSTVEAAPLGEQFFKTSYDCTKSSDEIEKTICLEKELAAFDIEMTSLYKSLIATHSTSYKIELKKSQIAWLKTRNVCINVNNKNECIKAAYTLRIDELVKLQKYQGGQPHSPVDVAKITQHNNAYSMSSGTTRAAKSTAELIDDYERNKKSCQDYTLIELTEVKDDGSILTKKRTWKLQYKDIASLEISDYDAQLYACVDIDNDGMPEAIILHNTTGGMHCCRYFSIHKIKDKTIEPVGQFTGSESTSRMAVVDLRKDGNKEFVMFEGDFYLEGISRVQEPELPKIICYKDGKFIECTNNYPELLWKEIDVTLEKRVKILNRRAELEKRYGPDSDWSDLKGNALQYLFLCEELKEDAWKGLRQYYPQVYKSIEDEYRK